MGPSPLKAVAYICQVPGGDDGGRQRGQRGILDRGPRHRLALRSEPGMLSKLDV